MKKLVVMGGLLSLVLVGCSDSKQGEVQESVEEISVLEEVKFGEEERTYAALEYLNDSLDVALGMYESEDLKTELEDEYSEMYFSFEYFEYRYLQNKLYLEALSKGETNENIIVLLKELGEYNEVVAKMKKEYDVYEGDKNYLAILEQLDKAKELSGNIGEELSKETKKLSEKLLLDKDLRMGVYKKEYDNLISSNEDLLKIKETLRVMNFDWDDLTEEEKGKAEKELFDILDKYLYENKDNKNVAIQYINETLELLSEKEIEKFIKNDDKGGLNLVSLVYSTLTTENFEVVMNEWDGKKVNEEFVKYILVETLREVGIDVLEMRMNEQLIAEEE